jgi:hypothetical protein
MGGLDSSSSGGGSGGSFSVTLTNTALLDVCTADDCIVSPVTIETFLLARGATGQVQAGNFGNWLSPD